MKDPIVLNDKHNRKQNDIDFNVKYLSKEAANLREKLKSRISHSEVKGDSSNSNNQPPQFNDYKPEIERNINEKVSEENNIYQKQERLMIKTNHKFKDGLGVKLNDESIPNLSIILDSENELNLNESQMKKLIIKNLKKQYNFESNQDIQTHLKSIISRSNNFREKENQANDKAVIMKKIKPQKTEDENNNKLFFARDNKKNLKISGSKVKPRFFQNEDKHKMPNKIPCNCPTKKYVGELINFDNNKNKKNNKKPTQLNIENANMAEAENEKELSSDQNDESDDSLMECMKNMYKKQQNRSESPIGDGNEKSIVEKDDKHIENEVKKLKSDPFGSKASLMNEFKNSNFYNKFKIFQTDNFKKAKNKNNTSPQRKHLEDKKTTTNNKTFSNFKNVFSIKGGKYGNPMNNYSEFIKKNKLTKKELHNKKLDDLYIRSIDYDKILKQNITLMKSLFPLKKANNKCLTSIKDIKYINISNVICDATRNIKRDYELTHTNTDNINLMTTSNYGINNQDYPLNTELTLNEYNNFQRFYNEDIKKNKIAIQYGKFFFQLD